MGIWNVWCSIGLGIWLFRKPQFINLAKLYMACAVLTKYNVCSLIGLMQEQTSALRMLVARTYKYGYFGESLHMSYKRAIICGKLQNARANVIYMSFQVEIQNTMEDKGIGKMTLKEIYTSESTGRTS